jgi:hypothetical protein
MTKVALVAESKNDAQSFKNLLGRKYRGLEFTHIAKNRKGSQLDSDKLRKELKAEFAVGAFKYWIFIRDLDALESDSEKLKLKHKWFKELNKTTGDKGVFLLNIYELEALILADINNFNKIFKITLSFKKDPMRQVKPKEFLMEKTTKHHRKYKENDCPELFEKLDISILTKRCGYFKDFIATFDKKLKTAA